MHAGNRVQGSRGMGSSHCCDGAIARSVLYMVRYSIKAGNGWGSTDGKSRLFSTARLPAPNRSGNGCGACRPEDRRTIGTEPRDLDRSDGRWNAAMPISRSRLLWELRSRNLQSNSKIARLIFFVAEGRIGVLHGFIKEDPENATRRDRTRAKADEGDDEITKTKEKSALGDRHLTSRFLDEAGIRESG